MRQIVGCVVLLCAAFVFLANVRADEEKVPLDKVPKAVLDAVKTKFPKAKLLSASTEKEKGKTVFEISLKYKGAHHDVTVDPEGKILDIEKTIDVKDLPKAVCDALESKYPKATHKRAEELTKGDGTLHGYEVLLITAADDTFEVVLNPTGKILKEEKKAAKKKEAK